MKFLKRLLGPNIEKLEARGDVAALMEILRSDSRKEDRVGAIESMGRIEAAETRRELIEFLLDEDEDVARCARTITAGLGEAAAAPLVELLGGRGREVAASLLLDLKDNAVEALRQASISPDEKIRYQALAILVSLDAGLKSPEMREILFRSLLAALGDRSPECRVLAADELGKMAETRAGRGLAAQLKDGHEEVRNACRKALLMIGETSLPHLLNALEDRNPNSRRLAAELLGEICSGKIEDRSRLQALYGLIERVKDSHADTAAAVHRALKIIPGETVIRKQLETLKDPESSGHEEIREFLEEMLEHGFVPGELREKVIKSLESGLEADSD